MNEKGLHIIANFFECENTSLLVNEEELRTLFINSVNKNGMTPLQNFFYKFGEDGGITGYILLSESHVSIHTWPEKNNYLAMDIFVCNYTKDNTDGARKVYEEIKAAFRPKKIEETFLERE
jgi:S-adenosylmethionine decarboxylase proenzyme